VRYKNGDIYVGNMEDDDRDGHGTLMNSAGTYVGDWANGKKHGSFMFTRVGVGTAEQQRWECGVRVV